MSADKYPSIFSRQMKAIGYLLVDMEESPHPLNSAGLKHCDKSDDICQRQNICGELIIIK